MAALQGETYLRGTVPLTASESIAVDLLIEDHTTVGQVSLCPAAGCPLGINKTGATIASGAVGDVQLLSVGDTFRGISSATITVGDYVKAAASGQVAPEASVAVRTANTIGVALSTTSGSAAVYVRVTP
jgi:hypothetical protein